jgi:hypothetical protein
MYVEGSAVDPDPDLIRIQWGTWIRIRIRNPDPDPRWQKWPRKIENRTPVVWTSFMGAEG